MIQFVVTNVCPQLQDPLRQQVTCLLSLCVMDVIVMLTVIAVAVPHVHVY